MLLGDRIELADEENVLRGFHIGIREVLQDFKDSRTSFSLVLLNFFLELLFSLLGSHGIDVHIIFQPHFLLIEMVKAIPLSNSHRTRGSRWLFEPSWVGERIIDDQSMLYADILVRPTILIDIG